jgi:hypothetical protein
MSGRVAFNRRSPVDTASHRIASNRIASAGQPPYGGVLARARHPPPDLLGPSPGRDGEEAVDPKGISALIK